MKIFRTFASSFVLFLLVSNLSGVSHAEIKPTPAKTFSFRLTAEPETLDWNRGNTIMASYILYNLMEGLVSIDQNSKVIPALAERWTISDDQKTYTFYLRRDVKWSDGVTMTVSDFITSWKRMLSPKTAAPYAYMLYDIEGAEDFAKGKNTNFDQVGVKGLNSLTLQVKLSRPVASWLYVPSFLATFPMRQDVLDKYSESWAKPGKIVTLGPYLLESYEFDSKIVLKTNPHYYGKKGNVEEVIAYIIKDANVALSMYEAGRLDFISDMSIVDMTKLKERKDLKTFPFLKTGYLSFITSKFPMSNVHFRRAVAMALDKNKMNVILHGDQKHATTIIPPNQTGYSEKVGLAYNLSMARSEIKASGYDVTNGPEIELPILNWDNVVKTGEFIQSELKKHLGIRVKLIILDHKEYRNYLDLGAAVWFLGRLADYPDPDFFMSFFRSNSGNNRMQWNDSLYDQKVLDARGMIELKMREKLYVDAQKYLLEENSVVVPLYYEPNITLIHNRVKGLELNPLNFLNLRNVNLQ